jgi:4-hydroxybenzoate polyprenyltransferase
VHQWLKNLLLLVPLLTAFSFMNATNLVTIAIAMLAFSLAASATYIVNDLWDLDCDRAHPTKQHRPLASGVVSILQGLALATACLGIALALATSVSVGFLAVLLVYLVSTLAYSYVLKHHVLVDVLTLSLLYTLRIIAGAVAIGITTSSWLLAFSVFIFFSLAMMKRCAELVMMRQKGIFQPEGRDYRTTDLDVLRPLGVGAALSAVVVFGLFINSVKAHSQYATPELLWLVALGLMYWLGRIWIKTSRGEMHDDPVVFAMTDRGSRAAILAMVLVVLVAHFFAWDGIW